MGVLLKTPTADFHEAEHTFDDAEDMFHATAGLGLHAILGALPLIHDALVPIAAVREVLGLGGVLSKNIGLALIGRVTPHPGLIAMKKIGEDRGVVNVGSRRDYGMDDFGLAVDADMGFHAEVPLVALLGLVPVGVAFPRFVLCR